MKKMLLLSFMSLFLTYASFGQSMVKDLSANNNNTFISGMGELNGKLYFIATQTDGATMPTSLFQSDGTDAGTVQLMTGLNSYAYNASSPSFFNVNGKLVFYAGDESGTQLGLWSTDGTQAGTVFLAACNPQVHVLMNGAAYFLSYGELWKTDGTVAGTVKLADVKGNTGSSLSLVAAGNHIFFQGNAGKGLELWTSDGTVEGTKLLKDMDPTNVISYNFLENFTVYKGKVYFMGYNPKIYRRCVAVSDGTVSGTDWAFTGKNVWWLNATSSKLFMFEGGGGNNFYVSDGTDAGTTTITAADQFANTAVSFVANDLLYVLGGKSSNVKLIRTDGTLNGTFSIKDSTKSIVSIYGTANNRLYFAVGDPTIGTELYSTDGTKDGTKLIKDINPGKSDGAGAGLLVGNTVYFQGNNGVAGSELWKYQFTASSVNGKQEQPLKYELLQNYPNPFNPATKISYSIPDNRFVTVKVYNVLGKEIATLVNGYQNAGSHSIQFNASNLSSGIYFCRIEAGSFTKTLKMTLLK